MRKIFKLLLVAVLAAPSAISCSNDDSPDRETNSQTPDAVESQAKTSEGVSIRATGISADDFNLNLEMGSSCQAFRFDVMPLIKFQNDLMEARKGDPGMDEESFIIDKLFNDTGNSGFAPNTSFNGSWSESVFKQAQIVNGIEYIVLTCGTLDADAMQVGEVNTLTIPLKEVAVVGNPEVGIDLFTNSIGFEAAYTMNDDCYGYYSLETATEAVDEALKQFGEKGLRDLICTFSSGPSTEDDTVTVDWGYEAVAGAPVTVVTVAIDINGTLAATYSRADDVIKEEADNPEAKYTVNITGTSAMTATPVWDIDYDVTSTVFYRVFKSEEWAEMKAKYTERQIQIELADAGYGINLISPPTLLIWGDEVEPDTEYILVSTGRNKGMKLSALMETPFRTKPLEKGTPELSKAQISAQMLNVDKTTMRVEYLIPEGTTLYFDCVLEKGSIDYDTEVDLTDPANKARMIDYLLANGNVSSFEYGEGFTFNDLNPSKTYCYFLIAEDANGILGPLYTFEFSTANNDGGDNPAATVTGATKKQADGSYIWEIKFEVNEDVNNLLYCTIEDNVDPDAAPSAAKIDQWTDNVIEAGMTTIGSNTLSIPVTEESTVVALALPYGRNDKQGELAYLIFNPKTMMSSQLSVKALRL